MKVIDGINTGHVGLYPLLNYIEERYDKKREEIDNLTSKVLKFRDITGEDINAVFGKGYTTLFSELENVYKKAYTGINLKRHCGNTYFIHLVNMGIMSHLLGLGISVTRTAFGHDWGENFCKSPLELEKVLEELPFDIRTNDNILTNKYKIIAEYLRNKSLEKKKSLYVRKHMLSYCKGLERRIKDEPSSKTIKHTIKLIEEYKFKKEQNLIDYLIDKSYGSYIFDIKEAKNNVVKKVKLLDAIDNTRTESPLSFEKILNIPNKNKLILSLVKNPEESMTKEHDRDIRFLYYFLIDLTLRQLLNRINKFNEDAESDRIYTLRFEKPIEDMEKKYDDFYNTFKDEWYNYSEKLTNKRRDKIKREKEEKEEKKKKGKSKLTLIRNT